MSIERTIGIDVAKSHLDICVPGRKLERIANNEDSLRQWAEGLAPQRVVMEASGGYERTAVRLLGQMGFSAEVLNPRKVRRLADALGSGAKTDQLDAELLSRAGGILASRATPAPEQARLKDMTRHARRLAERLAALRKQAAIPELCPLVADSIQREIEFVCQELERFRAELASSVSQEQQADVRLLKSIPGIGITTALVLLAELPENLEQFSAAQLSSYAGLAPMDFSSGTKTGQKRIRKGNGHIKRILYCAALVVLRGKSEDRQFYDRLRERGKAHQAAAVAVMRRLLKRAVLVLKRKKPWVLAPET